MINVFIMKKSSAIIEIINDCLMKNQRIYDREGLRKCGNEVIHYVRCSDFVIVTSEMDECSSFLYGIALASKSIKTIITPRDVDHEYDVFKIRKAGIEVSKSPANAPIKVPSTIDIGKFNIYSIYKMIKSSGFEDTSFTIKNPTKNKLLTHLVLGILYGLSFKFDIPITLKMSDKSLDSFTKKCFIFE